MKPRFNEHKQYIGREEEKTCTSCKTDFTHYRDNAKCKWIVEKSCECGKNEAKE